MNASFHLAQSSCSHQDDHDNKLENYDLLNHIISGVVAGPVVHKLGIGWGVKIGTTFVAAGYLLSALAKSVSVLCFTHGFIAGEFIYLK